MSVKKLKIEYGDSVFSLPREKLLAILPEAGGFELKVLLLAASDDDLRRDASRASDELCKRLDCTPSALSKAIDFWMCAGVLTMSESDTVGTSAPETKPVQTKKKTLQSSELPIYTESRAADVMEKHIELAGIIDACQQIAEKIFTPNEVQSVVAIYDYLGLTDEGYIVTLYQFCKQSGKTSPRYVEKVAVSLYDDGITTTSMLNDYIKKRDMLEGITSKFRTLIGAGDRKLTSKEASSVELWSVEWGFDYEVIGKAYEITVERIGQYKLPYMSRILENWHNAGLVTAKDIDESLESYRKKKAESSDSGDFEESEYFEAALARSQRYLEETQNDD